MVALKRFRKRGRGHIIQIGSALGYLSIPLQSAYCASKHAIHGYIQSLRIELKAQRSPIELSEAMLPAVNTPQFEWMKNHMDKHPSPVPPIFEPELIARSIVSLAEYPQKEMWIGEPSVKAILGEKIATRIAEWRLSKIGYKAQYTDIAPPTGLSNLWAPVEVDMGARGIFSSQSRKKSFFIWAGRHKKSLFFISSLIFLGSSIKKVRV
jgi:NAD(P)-dependent dehydrogenase (short-subunit alcohol dehydrogenase family)